MSVRGDRDPTDLGLPSDADYTAALDLRTRRRHRRGDPDPVRDGGGPSRTIGPATPPPGGGSTRVREHMDAIYAQMQWCAEELTEEEERRRTARCSRPECRAEIGGPCTDLVGGVRRRPRAVSHPERRVNAEHGVSDVSSG